MEIKLCDVKAIFPNSIIIFHAKSSFLAVVVANADVIENRCIAPFIKRYPLSGTE